ncbi:MAG: sulfatase-like hydrolase/transferase [Solirubrobacterales bacterium]
MSKLEETERPWKAPSILLGGGHLAALWALAIVQPLLSLLGSNPDFFVARDNTGGQIIAFVLLITFLPPITATAIEALLNLVSSKARWAFHLLLVAILFALLVLQVFKQVGDGPAVPMIVLAAVAGVWLAWAYGYRTFVRSLTDILIPTPLIILVVFLFFSEASELTTTSSDVQAIEASIENPAPVVMVVFDEFPVGSLMTPEGEINPRRFPHFAELESQANWYRNAVTDASYTAIAVPSILTGMAADRDSLPTAADHPESIFTLLGGSYRVRAIEPITQLCPPDVCDNREREKISTSDALTGLFEDLRYVSAHLSLPEEMSSSLPDISQSFEGFAGNPVESIERGRARQWVRDRLDEGTSTLDPEGDVEDMLADRKPAPTGTFDFVHVEEPHYPWTRYPDGQRYTEQTEDFRAFFNETAWLDDTYVTDRARQAHLLQTGFADDLLGRIIDRIKDDGLWNETMLVVTADHGGAMTKGLHRREATPETMGQIAMIPLFIKAPGQNQGRIVERTTCVAEILPIMATHLGVNPSWDSPECDRGEVTVDNGTGEVISSPMSTVLDQRDAYINTLADLFGGDTGWPEVLKLGPNQDLIGQATSTLNISPDAGGATATPDLSGSAATDFEPAAELNPVLRQRGVLSGVPDNAPLAVSVNGRIAAVGRSYREADRTRYSVLLPESSLRSGSNEIRVYTAKGGPGVVTLSELWSSANE